MNTLYTASTPDGWEASGTLEELALPDQVRPISFAANEQTVPWFLAVDPNGRIPAIVDDAPPWGGEPHVVFESGAILLYLADKAGRLLPVEPAARSRAVQWLMFRMGEVGPIPHTPRDQDAREQARKVLV